MKKKILSTVLALGMLASAVPAAFAEETPAPVLAEDTAVVEPEFKASYLNVSVKVLEKGELLHTQLLDTEGEDGLYDIAIDDNTLIFDTKGNALTADEKLPSVRELAATLAINPNTIQRAYRDLEKEG